MKSGRQERRDITIVRLGSENDKRIVIEKKKRVKSGEDLDPRLDVSRKDNLELERARKCQEGGE